jgi:hypothetical protein
MKLEMFHSRFKAVCVAGLVLLLAGCATERVDWAARVGHYTYDQAIAELGPPNKSAKLTDGTQVADWLTQHGETIVTSTGAGYYPYRRAWVGPMGPNMLVYNTPDYYLRLTFDPAGQLKSWKNIQQ